ncbi:lipoxygenase homology domain-containing protein 1-like [Glandiceps talaboti]
MAYPGDASGGGGGFPQQMPPGFQPGQMNPQMAYMMMAARARMSAEQMPPLDDTTGKILVETGEVSKDCGTNAQVYIEIFGANGSTGEIALGDPNGGYFEPGGTSEFGLKIPMDIGKPFKVRLRHDNSGKKADWYVEKVVLTRKDTELVFPFGQWLSNKKGDKVIIKESAAEDSGLSSLRYEVVTKTGKEKNAGTDANVWVKVFGENGDSGQRWLSSNVYLNKRLDKFKKGKSDNFSMTGVDLGKLSHVIIGHDGKKKADDWFVQHIVVKTPDNGPMYWFPLNKWVGVEQGKPERKIDCAGVRNELEEDSD